MALPMTGTESPHVRAVRFGAASRFIRGRKELAEGSIRLTSAIGAGKCPPNPPKEVQMISQSLRGAIGACLVVSVTLTAQAVVGTVSRVIDGGTMVVDGVGTVRLIGVDTPETVHPSVPVQHFGAEATAFTERLAQGKQVRLEFEGILKDRYDRTLAYVHLRGGTLLNAEIIRQGFAHAYTDHPFAKMEEFRQLQRDAAEAGKGLWGSGRVEVAFLPSEQQSGSETVYVTKTGTKYHRAGCRHLARSQIPMPLRGRRRRGGATAGSTKWQASNVG